MKDQVEQTEPSEEQKNNLADRMNSFITAVKHPYESLIHRRP